MLILQLGRRTNDNVPFLQLALATTFHMPNTCIHQYSSESFFGIDWYLYKKSQKSFLNENKHVGMEPSKTNKTRWDRMTPQYFPPSLYIRLVPTMPCVSGVHRRAVEGSGVGNPGCVVHVYMYGDRVMLWIAVIGCECSCY